MKDFLRYLSCRTSIIIRLVVATETLLQNRQFQSLAAICLSAAPTVYWIHTQQKLPLLGESIFLTTVGCIWAAFFLYRCD